MDIPALAAILSGSFLNFRGGPEELYRSLLSRTDFRSLSGVPSNDRGFLLALKEIGTELRAFGVEVTVLSTSQIRIQSRAAAVAEQAEESQLRTEFFSKLPAGTEARRGFQNSEEGFVRYLAYKRGVDAGRIHPPRGLVRS
jgi:hypothetical protein